MPRRLTSFIDTFVADTESLGTPVLFRRWTAIATLAGALRQNVWIKTSDRLYPNMYVFLIAHPGVGKTRVLARARSLLAKSENHIAPISATFASLVDALLRAKIDTVRQPDGQVKYNSINIIADELGAFIHKYDSEMINGLSALYDVTPYSQERRTDELRIRIEHPQVNILAGATPQYLLSFLPEESWGQGFTSRTMLVFSDQRLTVDDFAEHGPSRFADLLADLQHIMTLSGKFTVTDEYRAAVNQWRDLGFPPVPAHPRLTHYVTRRRVHLYKLSMIASINRDDDLLLTEQDFLTGFEWLCQAENTMADIFKAGAVNADGQAMDDIVHWIKITDLGDGVSEQRIVSYARDKVPLHSILRIIEILENTGQIRMVRQDRRTGARHFSGAAKT